MICDICFYFTVANFIGLLFGADKLVITIPVFGMAAFISGILGRKKVFKYLPVLILFGIFFLIPLTVSNILLVLPPIVYTLYFIYKAPKDISTMDYSETFRKFFIVAFIILLMIFLDESETLEGFVVPYGLIFFFCSAVLMRMTRHDLEIIENKRFTIINTGSVFASMIAGIFFSSSFFLTAFGTVIKNIYFTIIAPILLFILTILMYLLWPLFYLFELIPPVDVKGVSVQAPSAAEILGLDEYYYHEEGYDVLSIIVITVLILIALYYTYKFFRRISDIYLREEKNKGIIEERTAIDENNIKGKQGKSQNSIRELYKKILLMLKARGEELLPKTTTMDIRDISSGIMDKSKASEIRSMYMKIRYGEENAEKEEIKEFKRLYGEFKKASRKKEDI